MSGLTNLLLAADGQLGFGNLGATWGLYDQNGGLVLQPDSIFSVEYRGDSEVSTYPQEQGAFATYNKVASPFVMKIVMTKGGSDADRGAFLGAVDAASQTLDLYSVVMPEATYPSVNIDHYDFTRRAENGVGLLTVELWVVEVRVSGTATFSSTAQPSGADPINTGTVNPTVPDVSTSTAAFGFT